MTFEEQQNIYGVAGFTLDGTIAAADSIAERGLPIGERVVQVELPPGPPGNVEWVTIPSFPTIIIWGATLEVPVGVKNMTGKRDRFWARYNFKPHEKGLTRQFRSLIQDWVENGQVAADVDRTLIDSGWVTGMYDITVTIENESGSIEYLKQDFPSRMTVQKTLR